MSKGKGLVRKRSLEFFKFLFKLLRVRNKRSRFNALSNGLFEQNNYSINKANGNTLLFLPTNGAGLGHLTRLLAIAKRVKEQVPEVTIIFLSTSAAMHLILQEGFIGYHLPPKSAFPEELLARQWNQLLRQQLNMIINVHRPNILIYDGASLYIGLISSIKEVKTLKAIWIKRAQKKIEKAKLQNDRENAFSQIVIPGEIGSHVNGFMDKECYVNPVIHSKKEELLSRKAVRKQWGIDSGKKIVYIQLGAGNINDISSILYRVIQCLKKIENLFFVIGESVIGHTIKIDEPNIKILRDYPNAKYYKAFDLAISAAGYNTFYELLYFGVPSIFIPNEETKADNQIARAKIGEEKGACRVILEKDIEKNIEKITNELLELEMNGAMSEVARNLIQGNGADQISDKILEFMQG